MEREFLVLPVSTKVQGLLVIGLDLITFPSLEAGWNALIGQACIMCQFPGLCCEFCSKGNRKTGKDSEMLLLREKSQCCHRAKEWTEPGQASPTGVQCPECFVRLHKQESLQDKVRPQQFPLCLDILMPRSKPAELQQKF